MDTIFITVFAKYLENQKSLVAFKPLPDYLSFMTAVCLGKKAVIF